MTNKAEWTYCPECGSEEIRHEEGIHKQCADCHQEWFADVDYSDVVRKHLSGKYIDKDAQIERLRAELGECKGEYDRAVNKVDALREQLANALAIAKQGELDDPHAGFGKLVDALSASAEPKWWEPAEQPSDLHEDGLVGPFTACPPGEVSTTLKWDVLHSCGIFIHEPPRAAMAIELDVASARAIELADLLSQAREHVPQAHPLRGLINANLMQHQLERGPKQ